MPKTGIFSIIYGESPRNMEIRDDYGYFIRGIGYLLDGGNNKMPVVSETAKS